ncbi:nucleotidyl transferase AbiEii/AbiGii toxin family protein [Streptomyces scabiei]|uniref:nucleotidyl transferase AbiEii/AbiGii toxin family protein n=1 Tax=Streptomyces scabiei TaxID=1930 RepID=UPI0029AF3EAE|nr:nucleotidyl transferase AbiEii/AbiGii toxin family protein [Streptomyces scabiei]MDX2576737.1 nucleotidyl transferase AbiEii/AbiGii toxin family protein [Streptomyces scabiei]MDX3027151.1 nucleotidyl transferase AbiEii/AbiGii toxin family protein [Streptomyces scabiei]MDX3204890.1 nucleotidyl transferase AbiEii/AbiGii toxin family protein [Streptomyces scabiei]
MRLPDLHRRLLSDALDSGHAYRLVLAGGYAIQAHELVSRTSQDLDLATDAPEGMTEITSAVAAGLEDKGWGIRIVEVAPRMARLLATDAATGASCELDILKEIFHRPPMQTDAGPTLSRDDAVGLKVRALHDRGFPRDVIDVFSARELYTIGELERLGAQHDEEFDLEELHGRLEAVDFTSDREYAAYDMSPAHIAELRAWVRHWLDDLGLRLAEPYAEDEDGD